MDSVSTGLAPATNLKTPSAAVDPALIQVQAAVVQKPAPAGPQQESGAHGTNSGVAPIDRAQAEDAVKSLQDSVDSRGVKLNFVLHGQTGALQVVVKDAESGKVIRKIPQDEIMKLDQSLKDQARGLKENYV